VTAGMVASAIEQTRMAGQGRLRQTRMAAKGGLRRTQTGGQAMATSAMVLLPMLLRRLSDGPSALAILSSISIVH